MAQATNARAIYCLMAYAQSLGCADGEVTFDIDATARTSSGRPKIKQGERAVQ